MNRRTDSLRGASPAAESRHRAWWLSKTQGKVFVSLRVILAVAAALQVAVVALGVNYYYERHLQRSVRTEIETRLIVESRNLALLSAEALLTAFPELTLVPMVTDLLAQRQDLSFAVVVDHNGIIQGDADPRRVGTRFAMPADLVRRTQAEAHPEAGALWESDTDLMAVTPVIHGAEKRSLGTIYLGLNKTHIEQAVMQMRRDVTRYTLFALPVIVLLAAGVMSLLLRPVSALREGLARIGRGDLDQPMRIRDITEMGMLAGAINDLAVRLKASMALARERDQEIIETQKEIIHTLGEVVENRDNETGNHVRRVGEMCYHLACLAGLDETEAQLVRLATPMHDVGKIGIPDSILNKPGKLTPEEYAVIQTHTEIGHRILAKSERPIIKAAAIIAHEHHEKWDGTGYPRGLSGEQIHIFGRLVSLVDVFDAVYSDRIYRPGMPLDKVLTIIREGRGRHFDPRLVDLFLAHLDEFLAIHKRYRDDAERAVEKLLGEMNENPEPTSEPAEPTLVG